MPKSKRVNVPCAENNTRMRVHVRHLEIATVVVRRQHHRSRDAVQGQGANNFHKFRARHADASGLVEDISATMEFVRHTILVELKDLSGAGVLADGGGKIAGLFHAGLALRTQDPVLEQRSSEFDLTVMRSCCSSASIPPWAKYVAAGFNAFEPVAGHVTFNPERQAESIAAITPLKWLVDTCALSSRLADDDGSGAAHSSKRNWRPASGGV